MVVTFSQCIYIHIRVAHLFLQPSILIANKSIFIQNGLQADGILIQDYLIAKIIRFIRRRADKYISDFITSQIKLDENIELP